MIWVVVKAKQFILIQKVHFDLNVFSLEPEILAYFVDTFAAVAREGLGSKRSKAEMQRVRRLAFNNLPEQIISTEFARFSADPATLDLAPFHSAPGKIRVVGRKRHDDVEMIRQNDDGIDRKRPLQPRCAKGAP